MIMANLFLPRFRGAALAVWRRNTLVWRKLMLPSILINFGEPFLYLLGLGYGLGLFIGEMMDMPYLTFLASGILASSAMNTASFEAVGDTYYYYTRDARAVVKHLEGIPQLTFLHRPANLEDVFLKLTGRELRD